MAITSSLASSLVQFFVGSPVSSSQPLSLLGAINERLSFQVGVCAKGTSENVRIAIDGPGAWRARIRRVGFVPLWHRNNIRNPEGDAHLPGLCPDPLYDEDACLVNAGETQAFYITLYPGVNVTPGVHRIVVSVIPANGKAMRHEVSIRIADIHIKPRHDFLVTNWFMPSALMDWYGTRGYDEKLWSLLPAYFRNMAEHGQNFISTPLFSWFSSRSTQLLRVTREGDRYRFDFSDVKRWVDLAREAGITDFEWMDLFTQWNASYIAKVYEGDPEDRKLLWQTGPDCTTAQYKKYAGQIGEVLTPDATGRESREFLSQLLPVLEQFLSDEGLHEHSWFHFGDEPEKENLENYRNTREMMRELAPWMRITDPFCWMEYADPELIELPFPRTHMVPEIQAKGQSTAAYYCGNPGPKSINRLMDTPLPQVRMNGWAFYRFGVTGFLHWAYNFWYRAQGEHFTPANPFANFDTFPWPHNAYGDCWSVYPGPDGPIDTLRWEAFGDSLQDYALLQTLNIPRDGELLRDIKGFSDFPIDEGWITAARSSLLEQAGQPSGQS